MEQPSTVVQMPIEGLQAWLIAGIRVIGPEERWCGDTPVAPEGKPAMSPIAYITIPEKYGRLLDTGRQVLVLIDDVEHVSMATAQLTEEWRIRMEGLGEGWLPFRFLPELSEAKPTMPMSTESEVETVAQLLPTVESDDPRQALQHSSDVSDPLLMQGLFDQEPEAGGHNIAPLSTFVTDEEVWVPTKKKAPRAVRARRDEDDSASVVPVTESPPETAKLDDKEKSSSPKKKQKKRVENSKDETPASESEFQQGKLL